MYLYGLFVENTEAPEPEPEPPAEPEPVPEEDDSEPKVEIEEDENGILSSPSTFTYDQVRVKSENPVPGIDLKRREVTYFITFQNLTVFI